MPPRATSDSRTTTACRRSTSRIFSSRRCRKSAELTLGSLADAAITGARGNSGIVFAQFLYGFSREARNESRLTSKRFAELARRAAQCARHSILAPVEGTMLTLLHDWAAAVYEQRLKMTDFADLLSYFLLFGRKPAFIVDVSPVVGGHCGPGAVGVCLMFG